MKRVYTNENRFDVDAMRAMLESHGVPTMLKNEFTAGIMGEVPFFETWPEIWVPDDWQAQAVRLIQQLQVQITAKSDWKCEQCNEENPGTFEICWNCEIPTTAILKA